MLSQIDADGIQVKARIAFIGKQAVVLIHMHLASAGTQRTEPLGMRPLKAMQFSFEMMAQRAVHGPSLAKPSLNSANTQKVSSVRLVNLPVLLVFAPRHCAGSPRFSVLPAFGQK